jgi:hypothetical protein
MIVCKIPFNAQHPRKVAKNTGGVWNPTKKVWVFESANKPEDISPKLRTYMIEKTDVKITSSVSHESDQSFWNWFLNSGE